MTILNIDEFRKLKVTDRKTWRKYCYDICTMCDWNVGEIKQYSDLYEYSGARSIIVVGLNYAKEVLNIKKEEIIIQNNTKEKKYSKAIQKLLLTKPEERKNLLKEITKTGEITLERLVIKIKEQVRDENQKNELLEVILPERKKELAISKEITMKKRKENQEEKDAQFFPLFENAISSDTITEANLISALSKDRYYRLLSLYKEKNPERYNKYIEKVNNNKNNIDDKLNNILKETIYKLLDNNSDRKYDIVDFYIENKEYIKLVPRYISKSNLTKEEKMLLRNFLREDIFTSEAIWEKEKKGIIEGTDIINIQRDKYGKMIPNSGFNIPREEKEYWFNFLLENEVPITRNTIKTMRKRYIDKIAKENHKARKLTK